MALPAPDRPGSNRTTRNAVATVRPVRRKMKKPKNKKIVWYGQNKPKLDPNKFTVAKRGGGLGYVATRKPAAPAAAPAPAPGPYDEYKDTAPWAIPGFKQIDTDEKFHTSYVGDKVLPWASASLTGIQNYQDAATKNYLGQVQGAVQGAYNQSAAATPQQVQGTTGGAVVAGDNSYLTSAGSQYAGAMGSVATQLAANQAYLSKMQPATLSQGFINSLADYAKGLPQLYVQKRTEWRSKVDEAVAQMQQEAAKQAETMRHNKVTEAISAQNAQTQAALGFGNLGLNTTKEGNDQAATTAAASAPAPYGYFRDVDGNLVRDPSVPQASASDGTSTKGTYTANQLRKEGFSPLPKGAGAKWRQKATVADDGSLWIKAGKVSGGKGGKPPKVVQYGDLVTDLDKKFNGSGDAFSSTPGWAAKFRGNQSGLKQALAGWVIANGASITTGGKFDVKKLREILGTLGDGDKKFALIWPIIKPRIKNGKLA